MTYSARPRVFISAVQREFGRERMEIAKILEQFGFDPVMPENLPIETANDRFEVRRSIEMSDLFIGLYGTEYASLTRAGMTSYIQQELQYALKSGVAVIIFDVASSIR